MKNDGAGRIHTLTLGVRLFLIFLLELFDKLLPLCCLAHPHHHQALVVPFRYHRRLGAEDKHKPCQGPQPPLSISHARHTHVRVRKASSQQYEPREIGEGAKAAWLAENSLLRNGLTDETEQGRREPQPPPCCWSCSLLPRLDGEARLPSRWLALLDGKLALQAQRRCTESRVHFTRYTG